MTFNDFLFNSILDDVEQNALTCEEVLSHKICEQLREAAKKLKIEVKLIDEFIRDLVKKGITDAKEIIKKVREKLIELAKKITCKDILSDGVRKFIDLLNHC